MIIDGGNKMAIKMVNKTTVRETSGLLAGISLTDSQLSQGAEIMSRLRNGNGALILDKDGVITYIAEQIAEALKRAFNEHYNPKMGIEYGFDSKDVYRMFGLEKRYNDGPTPILALMSLNLEAQELKRKSPKSLNSAELTANDLLCHVLQSDNPVAYLDLLIEKYASQGRLPSREFVFENMYWWRESGGFFRSAEASSYIAPYVGPNSISSWDAVMALHDAGIKIAFLTNGPWIKSDWIKGGCYEWQLDSRTSICTYVPDTIFIVTRDQLGVERMKPDPFGLFLISEHMGISLKDSFFVGDTRADIECAYNSGVVTPIGVLSGMGNEKTLKVANPELIIYPDLPTLIAAILRADKPEADPFKKELLRPPIPD